jgi:CheY-like chemotaxis protein
MVAKPSPSPSPDLIVMDLEMPGITGWDAARLLTGDQRTRSIPIVALSGVYDTPSVMRAISAGCGRFVPKPCSAAALEGVVRSTLARDGDKTGGPQGVDPAKERTR